MYAAKDNNNAALIKSTTVVPWRCCCCCCCVDVVVVAFDIPQVPQETECEPDAGGDGGDKDDDVRRNGFGHSNCVELLYALLVCVRNRPTYLSTNCIS